MNNVDIKWAKVHPNAIIPTKRDEDLGMDIYACFDEDYIIIPSFTSMLVPTGIASAFSKDYGIVLRERGSTGIKNIKVSAGVLDSNFRGAWFVCIYNSNDTPLLIYNNTEKGNKMANHYSLAYPTTKAIAQAIIIPNYHINNEEISYDELLKIESNRGLGQLGSSGK